MNREECVVAGCAAAAAVLCFLPWFAVSMTIRAPEMPQVMGSTSANAFDSVEGWLAFLCAAATAGLIVADKSDMLSWSRKAVLLAPLLSAGAGVVFMLVFLSRDSRSSRSLGDMFSAGRTSWFYLALICMGVAAFFAFKRWQAAAQNLSHDR